MNVIGVVPSAAGSPMNPGKREQPPLSTHSRMHSSHVLGGSTYGFSGVSSMTVGSMTSVIMASADMPTPSNSTALSWGGAVKSAETSLSLTIEALSVVGTLMMKKMMTPVACS